MEKLINNMDNKKPMPVLFIGHGTPMNAIDDNEFSRGWRKAAKILPRPKAILCISAHWETEGTLVTGMEKPRTIHDFSGFPRELFEVQYSASGSPWLARETKNTVTKTEVRLDDYWGLDHGCWSVLETITWVEWWSKGMVSGISINLTFFQRSARWRFTDDDLPDHR